MEHVYRGHHVEDDLKDKSDVSAGFGYVFVFFVEREYEGIEAVDYQIYDPECEHCPHRAEHEPDPAPFSVEIGYYVSYPREHGKEHEQEIEDAVRIEDREQSLYFVMFVQYSPRDVYNEIDIRYRQEVVVTDDRALFGVASRTADLEMPECLTVYYYVKDQCHYTYDRVRHYVV